MNGFKCNVNIRIIFDRACLNGLLKIFPSGNKRLLLLLYERKKLKVIKFVKKILSARCHKQKFLSVDFLFCVDCWVASVSRSPSKGYFNAVVLEALTQQCGLIPVRFDTLKSNLNKLCKCKVFITIIRRYSNSNERYTR